MNNHAQVEPRLARAHARTEIPKLALTPEEAAASLGISRDTFDERVLPELRVVRLGRRILVPIVQLERFLERSAARWPDV